MSLLRATSGLSKLTVKLINSHFLRFCMLLWRPSLINLNQKSWFYSFMQSATRNGLKKILPCLSKGIHNTSTLGFSNSEVTNLYWEFYMKKKCCVLAIHFQQRLIFCIIFFTYISSLICLVFKRVSCNWSLLWLCCGWGWWCWSSSSLWFSQ